MKNVEQIYEGFVEPYYKKSTIAVDNRAGNSRKMRGEAVLSKKFFDMGKRSGKRNQRYADHPRN